MKKLYMIAVLLTAATIFMVGCKKNDDPKEENQFVNRDVTADFDPAFAAKLQEKGYIIDASDISLADVKDITSVDLSGTLSSYERNEGLTSIAGIEHFNSLGTLIIAHNQLTWLDVSKNTKLTLLDCYYNNLASLDVSKNTALIYLYCCFNQLTSLDVSKNTALIDLDCGTNQLTSLDVSKNTALDYLDCTVNQFTSLDVSKNKALTEFHCYWNPGSEGVLVVKAWFDNSSVPDKFEKGDWTHKGIYTAIEYQKVN